MARREKSPLEQNIQKYDNEVALAGEQLASEFLNEVKEEMGRIGLSRADMALILDLNRSQVSRLFNRAGNPTLKTLVSLASAVDHRLELHLKPVRSRTSSVHPNVIPPEAWLDGLREDSEDTMHDWALAGSGR